MNIQPIIIIIKQMRKSLVTKFTAIVVAFIFSFYTNNSIRKFC